MSEKCPKCGNDVLMHINTKNPDNTTRHICERCRTIWTDWQQSEIDALKAEVEDWKYKHDQADMENRALREQNEANYGYKKENESLRAEIARKDEIITRLNDQIESRASAANDMREKMDIKEARIGELENILTYIRATSIDDIVGIKAELSTLNQRLKEAAEFIDILREEFYCTDEGDKCPYCEANRKAGLWLESYRKGGEGMKCRGCGNDTYDVQIDGVGWMHYQCEIIRLSGLLQEERGQNERLTSAEDALREIRDKCLSDTKECCGEDVDHFCENYGCGYVNTLGNLAQAHFERWKEGE